MKKVKYAGGRNLIINQGEHGPNVRVEPGDTVELADPVADALVSRDPGAWKAEGAGAKKSPRGKE